MNGNFESGGRIDEGTGICNLEIKGWETRRRGGPGRDHMREDFEYGL